MMLSGYSNVGPVTQYSTDVFNTIADQAKVGSLPWDSAP